MIGMGHERGFGDEHRRVIMAPGESFDLGRGTV